MKITIVIPVYNVEPYIEDCLKSVAAQTYKGDIECIIVNDCTPDNSCVIIERFKKEYNGNIDFKLLHHTVNRGLSAARNTGIDAATGEYIYFLDSDDEITPDCIELLAEPLKEQKYDFVIGNYETKGTTKEFPQLLLNEGKVTTNKEIRHQYFAKQWYMMAVNKMCNIEFLIKSHLNFKEGLLNEDDLWSFQLACTANTMYVIKKSTYIYKVRESSITGKQDNLKRADSVSMITKEIYSWAKATGIIYNKGVLNKVLSYREEIFTIIFSQATYKERTSLYLKCYKRIRISPWGAYNNKAIRGSSLLKEIFNYMPGILGYWYLRLYNFILKR